jgi:hypothetical protein
MRRARFTPALVFACLLAGCAKTSIPTQVIVVVDAEADVRSHAETLLLQVRSVPAADPETWDHTEFLVAADNQLVLPYSLALTPKNEDHSRKFEVLVTALDAGLALVGKQRVLSGYLPQRRLLLPILLTDLCVGKDCPAGQTCASDMCVEANLDPASLSAFTSAKVPEATVSRPQDAGTMRDAEVEPDADAEISEPENPACPNGRCLCPNGASRYCDGTDVGNCDRGVQTCVDNVWGPCVGEVKRADEVCDNEDNDCDGNVDDGAQCEPADLDHTREAACIKGKCVPTRCESYWGDCNDNSRNDGCEQSLATPASCGECHVACEIDSALASCESGECLLVECDNDWDDCDEDGLSCETALNTVQNCGSCGTACEPPNAEGRCGGPPGIRSCLLDGCDEGFDDCDEQVENGCEIDIASDAHHCGACDIDCVTKPNLDSASCNDGTCVLDCYSDFVDCDADPNNGCERDMLLQVCAECLPAASNVVDAQNYTYPRAVDFSCGGVHTFDSSAGTWDTACCGDGDDCPDVSGPVAQLNGSGPPIVILRASSFVVPASATLRLIGEHPVVISVLGNATVAGVIDASANLHVRGAGGSAAACASSTGQSPAWPATLPQGAGGGGYATLGGLGGSSGTISRTGGQVRGAAALRPLLGGCAGGVGSVTTACTSGAQQLAGAGGGAFQLTVAGKLSVTGTLMANGGAGAAGCTNGARSAGSGGGSGGSILLEASLLDIASLSERTQVNGGAGGAGMGLGAAPGGQGATASGNASNGAWSSSFPLGVGGGGGGGYGRVFMRSCVSP